ncbi:MAG: Hsp70 family protein [Scytonematopsis contorta HA4267-MV1]|jgi:molecular chaperone DnaK (HSP70)|nr:Hsp70 family protein [Scytonematopsis contorta HA4267-MV1]
MDSNLSLTTLAGGALTENVIYNRLANATYVGIDFGTSTTTVSYSVIDDEMPVKTEPMPIPQLLPDGRIYESHLVPTVIAWHNEQLLVGVGASSLKTKLQHGTNLWSSFKMQLGEDLGPTYFNSKLSSGHPVAVVENGDDAAKVFFTFLKEKIECFVQEESLPTKIYYSVSVPASFESNQRSSLLNALNHAGIQLRSRLLIDEPNAAFLSYLAEASLNNLGSLNIPESSPLHILVFDFGAGTLDISILEIGRNERSFYSKNLAISRFTALGGDDIDKKIVEKVLLKQLCSQNICSVDDFRTADLNKRIIPQLQKTAEELKILVCKAVSSQMVSNRLPALATSTDVITLNRTIEIILPKNKLTLNNPNISYSDFFKVMGEFCAGTDDSISIFAPIESSLYKADLTNDDLDMILLIGGSSANPYVQSALQEYFENCEIEIPRDLRSHVSMGAAINSFLLNGLSLSVINPIVSEPILLIARDGLQMLIAAGTEITGIEKEFDFVTGANVQQQIEIPLCVGNENKILTVIDIYSDNSACFEPNTWVRVKCSLSEDKVLSVTATIAGKQVVATLINPGANRELTTEERLVFEAEKLANKMAARNGGKPTVPGLMNLVRACEKAKNYLRAAETMELVQMLDKNNRHETNICHYYDKAGKSKQAATWAKIAYDNKKTAINAFNLALFKKTSNNYQEYESLMEECLQLDDNPITAFVYYGSYLMSKNNEVQVNRGRQMSEKGFDYLYKMFVEDELPNKGYPILISAAKALGKNDIVKLVESSYEEKNRKSSFYDENNLLAGQINNLEQSPINRINPTNLKELF